MTAGRRDHLIAEIDVGQSIGHRYHDAAPQLHRRHQQPIGINDAFPPIAEGDDAVVVASFGTTQTHPLTHLEGLGLQLGGGANGNLDPPTRPHGCPQINGAGILRRCHTGQAGHRLKSTDQPLSHSLHRDRSGRGWHRVIDRHPQGGGRGDREAELITRRERTRKAQPMAGVVAGGGLTKQVSTHHRHGGRGGECRGGELQHRRLLVDEAQQVAVGQLHHGAQRQQLGCEHFCIGGVAHGAVAGNDEISPQNRRCRGRRCG